MPNKTIYVPDQKQWAAFVRLCQRRRVSVSERLTGFVALDVRLDLAQRKAARSINRLPIPSTTTDKPELPE